MNLLQRIGRLEKIAERNAPDRNAFIITHTEFLTLTLAEIALRHPETAGLADVGASIADIKGAERVDRIRRHPKRAIDYSATFAISHAERTEQMTASMRPRILRMKEAFESGDWMAYRRQQAKDRKALLARAEAIVDRVGAEIARMPQTVG